MPLKKFPVGQAIVLFASIRNCVVMGGHYSTRMVSRSEALQGREEVYTGIMQSNFEKLCVRLDLF